MMRASDTPHAVTEEIERLTAILVVNGHKTDLCDFVPAVSGAFRSVHYSRYGHPRDLSDKLWQDLRSRLFERAGKCENCGREHILELHHRHYFRGRRAWQYPDRDFAVLCRACHSLVHGKVDKAAEYLAYELRLHERLRTAPHREELRRLWEEFRADVLEAEYLHAVGEDRDPVDDYDPDNPGEWVDEYGEDPGDRAERLYMERGSEWEDED